MENIRRQFVNSLIEAEKYCLAADHLIHVSLKVVKDPKLLLRAFEDIYNALVLIISTVLRFEYLYKRISLKRDSKENLRIFINKCSKRYGLDEKDIGLIKETIFLGKKQKEWKPIPDAPRAKLVQLKKIYEKDEVIGETFKIYEMFRDLDGCEKLRENEFRKGVNLKVTYKGEVINVNLDKLKEYSTLLERFISSLK